MERHREDGFKRGSEEESFRYSQIKNHFSNAILTGANPAVKM
jgi:hypothetical protein